MDYELSPMQSSGIECGNRPTRSAMESLLTGFSIEVTPRTAEKIPDFRSLLPSGTRVYIAHIEGTPIVDTVATARRISAEGFPVMPHFPARIINDRSILADWIARYQGEAGVEEALVLAGGSSDPLGEFENSMQLLETGLFGRAGFARIHVAGHPEGNRDIDPDGSTAQVDRALSWKQRFAETSSADMAIVTQFCFDASPVVAWANRIREQGISLPVHIGAAGPAKLQTMIRFAVACGIGASLRVLRKRARDLSKLLLPFEPGEYLSGIADHRTRRSDSNIAAVHFFPLGGIAACAKWINANGGAPAQSEAGQTRVDT